MIRVKLGKRPPSRPFGLSSSPSPCASSILDCWCRLPGCSPPGG